MFFKMSYYKPSIINVIEIINKAYKSLGQLQC